ncbi:hypothetical protein AYK26_07010 [Euryarchaeota archaeon SM23-78]|nr:MAG: hypothetical protein AYK26_07010 [Euryarchaeota archaeon SM23-78]
MPIWNPMNIPSGTVFPTAGEDGIHFYRTDLRCLFHYDRFRGKWLGELEAAGAGRSGAQANGYLRAFNGMSMSASLGYWIPYNATITGISMVWITPQSGDLQVRRNGVVIATVSFVNATSVSDLTLNANFAANGVFAISVWNLTGNLTSPQARCWFRRHET